MAGRPPFILASASPRRLDLLRQVGLAPDAIETATLDERPLARELPRASALRLAAAKAAVVAERYPRAVVLGADTVVALGRRVLPKAADAAAARDCLARLSGRRHVVYTAVCVIDADGRARRRLAATRVRFKRLSAGEVAAYIACDEWRGKAGGYAIQGRAAAFIPWINGAPSTVVGLPLYETVGLLAAAGVVAAS